MNILVLTKKLPFPVKDGESVAIINLARNLVLQGCKIHMLSIQTPKHYFQIENIPGTLKEHIQFEAVFVDTSISITGILKNLFSNIPYHVQRFISKDYAVKLANILKEGKFEIVQLEGLFLAPYLEVIRRHSQAKIVLRSHNIEGNIWKGLSKSEKSYLKRISLNWQSNKLLKYESKNVKNYDAVVPISLADKMFFSEHNRSIKVKYIPSGIDVQEEESVFAGKINDLYFLGALDWLPNEEGLKWFIEKIFPFITKEKPGITFHIAGRNGGNYFKELNNPNIVFYGEVEDAERFLQYKAICVVPLLSGSGMKIKILEAMAHGKYVITTPVGIEGFPEDIAEFCAITAKPDVFANTVLDALQHPEAAANKGMLARQYVRDKFDNYKLAAELLQFYTSLL